MAVECTPANQPPPSDLLSEELKIQGKTHREAKVAEVAVLSPENLGSQHTARLGHRIDVCSHCGQADWKWNGSAWVCSRCGAEPNEIGLPGDMDQIIL